MTAKEIYDYNYEQGFRSGYRDRMVGFQSIIMFLGTPGLPGHAEGYRDAQLESLDGFAEGSPYDRHGHKKECGECSCDIRLTQGN